MKNRKFLASLTALVAVLASENSSANSPLFGNSQTHAVQNNKDEVARPFDFIIRNSIKNSETIGYHNSHMSHRSHSSHQSHFSGY